jgi:hypothetical protein
LNDKSGDLLLLSRSLPAAIVIVGAFALASMTFFFWFFGFAPGFFSFYRFGGVLLRVLRFVVG